MRSTALLLLALLAPLPAVGADAPLAALPYTPGLDPAAMDRSADPCADLYQFACGGWMAANPIPPDESSWSVYAKLGRENQQYLWGLLQDAARPDPARDPVRRRIGDFFAACMDEGAVESAGAAPLQPDLDRIAALGSVREIAGYLGGLHPRLGGGGPMFSFGAEQDPGDASRVIAWAFAGGLGLPDRDDYLDGDPRSVETRARYGEHVAAMLRLLGTPEAEAAAGAGTVVRIETALARASLTRVDKRDPRKIYHLTRSRALRRAMPRFRWDDYFAAAGMPRPKELNVTEPAFFAELDRQLGTVPLADWKTYLRWHLVNARAEALSLPFVRQDHAFYGAFLRGAEQVPPRWKRCVAWTDRDLGEDLGRVFVEATFSPETKTRVEEMVRRIEQAMERRIAALDWMGPRTKEQALAKLHALRNKIGYPETWRDYSALSVRRDDFAGNLERAAQFEARRQAAKIGRPVDRGEWSMTPPTVNAYYNPSMNDMNFPAGVLQPPLFDPRIDLAPGYGNTGATIGHELIHGFDDEGRRFDARGNLVDWWTEADARAFEERASCVADQYATYTVVDDITINSALTLGEDLADLAGTILAWEAWQDAVAGQALEPRDGLTPEQRFFVGYAQWDCNNARPEDLRLRARTNPHSPGRWRINGVVVNMPEFARAFACPAGTLLVKPPEDVCRVW